MHTDSGHWPRPSLLTIILAICTVVSFVAIANVNPYSIMPMIQGVTGVGGYGVNSSAPIIPQGIQTSAGSAPMRDQGVSNSSAMYPYPYPGYGQEANANDTREFLKVSYGATMESRDVQGLERRVVTTVRGYAGRIDQESSSPKNAYVSFVVPMSKYDDFRAELESLVDSRFLTVNISSQNMLPQKQSIEEQQKQADSSLSDYQAARQRLVSTHASTVKSLQSQMDGADAQLASLRAQPQTYEVQQQILSVTNVQNSVRQQLAQENASYAAQLNSSDINIKQARDWQTAVKTQDQALLDNVATVNGSVSIQWISLWQLAQRYLPGYWIPGIFALLTIISYLWDRHRTRPVVSSL